MDGPFRVLKLNENKMVVQKKTKTWTHCEMVRYTIFLQRFFDRKEDRPRGKMNRRDYEEMSGVVRSRNSNQCRIFHTRMLQMKGNLKDIFVFFSSNIKEFS